MHQSTVRTGALQPAPTRLNPFNKPRIIALQLRERERRDLGGELAIVKEFSTLRANIMETSNSRAGPSGSGYGKPLQEDDDHSDKKSRWRHRFRSAGEQQEDDDRSNEKSRWERSRTAGEEQGKKLGWRQFWKEEHTGQLEGMPQGYSYKQLLVATGGFRENSRLGQGGSGTVYRGVLPSGIQVAVKKINVDSRQGEAVKLFKDEVSIISRLSHRNVIELKGYCEDHSNNKYLVVYELMPNGSLDDALFGKVGGKTSLSFPKRLKVVSGIADGMGYLHHWWKKQVVHRDIKCSNIMLDEDWNAQVGDFGIARLVDHDGEVAMTKAVGTPGYIAPEVFVDGRFSDKSDVYGFGVVVLEVACGRRVLPYDSNSVGLVDWVWQSLTKGELLSTVDKQLEDYDEDMMKLLLMIGLACCHPDPAERPSMRHVIQLLAGAVPIPSIPASKPTTVLRLDSQISVTDLPGFEAGSPYRHRSTYVSASAHASTVKTSATYSSLNSGSSTSRMLWTTDEHPQPTLHGLHDAAIDMKGSSSLSQIAVHHVRLKAREYARKVHLKTREYISELHKYMSTTILEMIYHHILIMRTREAIRRETREDIS